MTKIQVSFEGSRQGLVDYRIKIGVRSYKARKDCLRREWYLTNKSGREIHEDSKLGRKITAACDSFSMQCPI